MRITSVAAAVTGALALVLTLGAAPPPADAGQACNRLGLPNNCVKSNDLKARLTLRESGRDGRLQIRDADNAAALNLDGRSGNVTNLFSNLEDESNGLVKAWAHIAANGSVVACWRCNTDPAETRLVPGLGAGSYEVDFTPLATDITGRPRSATIDDVNSFAAMLAVANRNGDTSSVFVNTRSGANAASNIGFVLLIY